MNYRNSHKNQGKGSSYKLSFEIQKYRKIIWNFEKQYLEKILSHYFINKKIFHLDFACGTGRILKFLERKTYISFGVDVSTEMIKVAKNSVQSKIICGDITKKKILKNKKFNLVTAFRFFPNAEKKLRKEVLKNIVPHIKKDGLLVLNNHRNKNSFLERIIRLFFGKLYSGMNLNEVKLMVKDYDLELVDIFSIGLFRDSYKKNFLIGLIYIIELLLSRLFKWKSYGYNQIYVFKKIKN